MRIRAQLVLAFLLLSVLPLTGIVLYSYYSSLEAVRRASAAEAEAATREMDTKLASLKSELRNRVGRLGGLPFGALLAQRQEEGEDLPFVGRILTELGDAAPLIESFEFVPDIRPNPATGEGVPQAPPAPPVPKAFEGTIDVRGTEDDPGVVVVDVEKILKELEESGIRLNASDRATVIGDIQRDIDRGIRQGARVVVRGGSQPEKAPGAPAPSAPLARGFEMQVARGGDGIGTVKARISTPELLQRILARADTSRGEIPFAIDSSGRLYTAKRQDHERLSQLGTEKLLREANDPAADPLPNWVVAKSVDEESGLTYGIARPIRESLAQVRENAARNFTYGLALVGLALLGIVPVANHMTRDIKLVTIGAERIAHGDLMTKVPVRSRNEFGQLAAAFNRMARDLSEHQERLLEEEGRRREQELHQRLLEAEFQRKTHELEEARDFQLSLLPKVIPDHPSLDLGVFTRTATEVGGDYYDFHLSSTNVLTTAVGDATGHGAKAGTMVTIIKSLFASYSPDDRLSDFLARASDTIRRMDLGRMSMALALSRFDGEVLTIATAGMPPVLIYRAATGKVEEGPTGGLPLGSFDTSYTERSFSLRSGDTVLLLTDGLPELADDDGEPFGYAAVETLFGQVAHQPPQVIIEALTDAAERWSGSPTPDDDMTFVVVKMREESAG